MYFVLVYYRADILYSWSYLQRYRMHVGNYQPVGMVKQFEHLNLHQLSWKKL